MLKMRVSWSTNLPHPYTFIFMCHFSFLPLSIIPRVKQSLQSKQYSTKSHIDEIFKTYGLSFIVVSHRLFTGKQITISFPSRSSPWKLNHKSYKPRQYLSVLEKYLLHNFGVSISLYHVPHLQFTPSPELKKLGGFSMYVWLDLNYRCSSDPTEQLFNFSWLRFKNEVFILYSMNNFFTHLAS